MVIPGDGQQRAADGSARNQLSHANLRSLDGAQRSCVRFHAVPERRRLADELQQLRRVLLERRLAVRGAALRGSRSARRGSAPRYECTRLRHLRSGRAFFTQAAVHELHEIALVSNARVAHVVTHVVRHDAM